MRSRLRTHIQALEGQVADPAKVFGFIHRDLQTLTNHLFRVTEYFQSKADIINSQMSLHSTHEPPSKEGKEKGASG